MTAEPSIERALDIISHTAEGRILIASVSKFPPRLEYSNTPENCHKFLANSRIIYLPRDLKKSDTMLALKIAKVLYIYDMSVKTGLEQIISEEEELATLLQARMAADLSFIPEDFEGDFAKNTLNEFCAYVMEGSHRAMETARNTALSDEPACLRPLETMNSVKGWLDKTKEAMTDESKFFQLLYERDLRKVERGILSRADAIKNEARIKALPRYDIYRFQREFYEIQTDVLAKIQKTYMEELEKDRKWRLARQSDVERLQLDFSQTCEY